MPAPEHTADTAEHAPRILARGPWEMGQVRARWIERPYEPSAAETAAADDPANAGQPEEAQI